jgi:hypothetical protein
VESVRHKNEEKSELLKYEYVFGLALQAVAMVIVCVNTLLSDDIEVK